MTVRMRINRSATGKRRSGHGLEEPRLSKCSNCGAPHLRHHMCSACGHYRGHLVTDVAAKVEKKVLKKEARRKEMGEEKPEESKDDKKAITSGELSKRG